MSDFPTRWDEARVKVESYLKSYLDKRFEDKVDGTDLYVEAVNYSVFSGGKRFRPALVLMTGELYGTNDEELLAFAAAVELIHCFSLVHDDLPCMDDDDLRRGKPTVHKKFNEGIALLAGDGLVMEAVELLRDGYQNKPELALDLIRILMDASGSMGMIAGQVVDLQAQKEQFDIAEIEQVHLHKTGALIRCCALGAARISGASVKDQDVLAEYSQQLGLAFQIKDDLLEVEEGKVEIGSYPGTLGVVATNILFQEINESCLSLLAGLNGNPDKLKDLVTFNAKRVK